MAWKTLENPALASSLQTNQNQPEQYEPESYFDKVYRNAAQYGARTGELLFGAPANIAGALGSGISALSQDWQKALQGTRPLPGGPALTETSAVDEALKNYTPTSENIRKVTKKLSNNYLEPRNEYEELLGDIVSESVALMTGGLVGKGIPKVTSLAVSGLGNLAKFGAKKIGVGPLGQEGVKLLVGTLAMHPYTKSQLKENESALFKEADTLIPVNAKANTEPAIKELHKINAEIGDKLSDVANYINPKLQEIEASLTSGKTPVKELIELKKKFNLSYSDKKPKGAEKYLKRISKALIAPLEEYGKENPKFWAMYKPANEIHAGLAKTDSLMDFIKGHGKSKYLNNPLVGSLFGAYAYHKMPKTPGALAATAATATGSYLLHEAYDAIKLLSSNPTVRNEYYKVLEAAAANNVSLMDKHLRNLSKIGDKKVVEAQPAKKGRWQTI